MPTLPVTRRRLTFALAVLLPLATAVRSGGAGAAPLLLITADEARRYPESDLPMERMLPRSPSEPPAGPRIELLRPVFDARLRLKSPFPIDVRFLPLPDAAIDPGTFRVLYGNLRLDVTARILDRVKVAAAGFSLPEAAIPAGRHRLLLRVDDLKGRSGELDLRFEVE